MPETIEKTEIEIIEALRKGDVSVFEKLFRQYYPELCRYLNQFLKDKDEVEEFVQEVFLYIWEKKEIFFPKGNIKSYLYRAVKNKAINYRKHEVVKQNAINKLINLFASKEQNIDTHFENVELVFLIKHAVEKLPNRCREVFVLVKFNNLSYKETSEVMNISTKTVEIQMGIALKKLREYLKPFLK